MAKHDPQGRSKGEARHTRLPHLMTGSPAWLALSGNAVKMLVALQRLDRGQDNGNLFFGARTASEAAGLSRNTAMRALRDLEEKGFIAPIQRGHFQVKGGPATRWRLTFVPAPACSLPPTNDWQRWQPCGNKTRAQNLTETGAKSDHLGGNAQAVGSKSAPMLTETSHVSVSPAGSISAPQVVYHAEGRSGGVSNARKQANSAGGVSTDLLGAELLDQLRERVSLHLAGAVPGEQTRLAKASAIPGGTLSKFLSGRGLSRCHFVALQLAMQNEERRKAA